MKLDPSHLDSHLAPARCDAETGAAAEGQPARPPPPLPPLSYSYDIDTWSIQQYCALLNRKN